MGHNFNLIQWLFTSPADATGDPVHPEKFHFYIQWLVFNTALIAAWFYYQVEGRRRFFSSHYVHRRILDKMLNQLAIFAAVGYIVLAFRYAATSSLLGDRFWRYGWLVWGLVLVIYWAVYFVRSYRDDVAGYREYLTRQQYVSPPKAKQAKRARGKAASVR